MRASSGAARDPRGFMHRSAPRSIGAQVADLPVIPADPSLVGRTWAAHTLVTGGPLDLTNAVSGTIR